jgi:hypothetical protein
VEVAVRDIDRDALLALGAQAVGQQGEVDVAVAAPPRGLLDVLQLVLEDRLRVEQEPADERRLAVVARAGCRDTDELGRCPRRGRRSVGGDAAQK